MPIRGVQTVRSNLQKLTKRIQGPMTEKTLTEILIIGGGYADSMTPVDIGNLLNSRFREIKKQGDKWVARYGYTAAYAAAVHGLSAKLRGQPRADFGTTRAGDGFGGGSGKGNYWDGPLGPGTAEPEWLTKGFERDGLAEIKAAIKRNMSL